MGETKTDVNTTKKIVRDTLNTLGNEWYRYYSDGNVDMQTKLQTKIFNVILANEKEMRGSYGSDLFLEAVNEFYCRDFKTFNPLHEGKKQTFYSFVTARLKLRKIDCYNRNQETKEFTVKEADQAVKKKRQKVSIEQKQEHYEETGEGGKDLERINEANSFRNPDDNILKDEWICELTMLFTKITQCLTGRQNNQTKKEYFKLFATENITETVRASAINNAFLKKRERDILSSLKEDFLDYYMMDKCRSLKEIRESHMKHHCEVEIGSTDTSEIGIPFSNKLYIAYLQRKGGKKVGDSAVSMQRNSFRELIKELYNNDYTD